MLLLLVLLGVASMNMVRKSFVPTSHVIIKEDHL
jgi:hypothetical protein